MYSNQKSYKFVIRDQSKGELGIHFSNTLNIEELTSQIHDLYSKDVVGKVSTIDVLATPMDNEERIIGVYTRVVSTVESLKLIFREI